MRWPPRVWTKTHWSAAGKEERSQRPFGDHASPASLLDFTTQFDVDPSHITLLNKDMLRLMFVLEGCKSRPDLEAKMDWGNKGRVLVLEKLHG